ncbi:hypothetical protein [Sphingomonas lenta]|uniref:hypothetical protein n=1 Tax=Sphingomonas lenta TaxID=1141887 RepID=UPI001140B1C4|nr:hypothetical protein [Sphingomonas lenta]
MSTGTVIMYAVATVFALVAIVLFARLRGRSERGRYAHLIAGTMAAAGSLMLFAYATALHRWSTAP